MRSAPTVTKRSAGCGSGPCAVLPTVSQETMASRTSALTALHPTLRCAFMTDLARRHAGLLRRESKLFDEVFRIVGLKMEEQLIHQIQSPLNGVSVMRAADDERHRQVP